MPSSASDHHDPHPHLPPASHRAALALPPARTHTAPSPWPRPSGSPTSSSPPTVAPRATRTGHRPTPHCCLLRVEPTSLRSLVLVLGRVGAQVALLELVLDVAQPDPARPARHLTPPNSSLRTSQRPRQQRLAMHSQTFPHKHTPSHTRTSRTAHSQGFPTTHSCIFSTPLQRMPAPSRA